MTAPKKEGSPASRFWPHMPTHWVPSKGNTYDPRAFKEWEEKYPQEHALYKRYHYLRRFNQKRQIPPPFKPNPRLMAKALSEIKGLTSGR